MNEEQENKELPDTAHDNKLGDWYNPVFDGTPGHCGLKKIEPLGDLNTEPDE